MVYCIIDAIKEGNKMQMDPLTLLLLCYFFGVDYLIFIPIFIVKEIVFDCFMYTATVWH